MVLQGTESVENYPSILTVWTFQELCLIAIQSSPRLPLPPSSDTMHLFQFSDNYCELLEKSCIAFNFFITLFYMRKMLENLLPFSADFSFGERKKSVWPKFGEYGGVFHSWWGTNLAHILHLLPPLSVTMLLWFH